MDNDTLQLLSCIEGIDIADEGISNIIKDAMDQKAKETNKYSNLVQMKNQLKTSIPELVSGVMPDVTDKVNGIADKFNFTDGKDYKLLDPKSNAHIDYDEKDVYIGDLTVISFKGDKCDNGYLDQRYTKIGYKTYKDYSNAIRKFKEELIKYLSSAIKNTKKSIDGLKIRVFENDSEIKIYVYDEGYCKKLLAEIENPTQTEPPKAEAAKSATEAARVTDDKQVSTKAELNSIVRDVNKAFGINAREWKKPIMLIMARYGLEFRTDYTYHTMINNPLLDEKTGRIIFPIISLNDNAPIIFRKRVDSLREVNNYLSENLDILEETYPQYSFKTKVAINNGEFEIFMIIKSKQNY